MRKSTLLSTTALVAVGFIAGEAYAADPVALKVGGYYRTSFVQILDDADGDGEGGDGFQDAFVKQDVEVHFDGQTALDNGLTVGIHVELEGQTNADQMDLTWAFVEGSWGHLRIGVEESVAYKFGYIGPYVGNFSHYSPYFNMTSVGNTAGFITPTGGSNYNTNFSVHDFYDSNSPRLIYMTPDLNGFQLGASYAPDSVEDTNSPVVDASNNVGGGSGISNIWDFVLTYAGEFNGVSVGLSGGYSMYSPEQVTDDPEAYSFGASFGYNGWRFGGSYQDANASNGTGAFLELELWEVSIAYAWDGWGVALGYSSGDWGASGSGLKDDTLSTATLGVNYSIGPGIDVNGGLSYSDLDNNAEFNGGAFFPDAEDISIGIGLTVDY
jgi:hypothetical protein